MGVFERQHLDNGVRILTARMPHSQSTAVYLGFAVGARYETSERRGIAHFVEHMLFTGTERRPTSVNKSANISSGNKSKHSRCSTP